MLTAPASLWVRLSPKTAAEFWQQTEYLREQRGCTWRWIAKQYDARRPPGANGSNTYGWLRKHACDARKGHPLGLDITDAVLIADILGHRVPALAEALADLDHSVSMLLGHPPTVGEPTC